VGVVPAQYSRVCIFAGLRVNTSRENLKFRENLPDSPRCVLCRPKHLRNHLQLTETFLNVLQKF
jgi:hypothetical protein